MLKPVSHDKSLGDRPAVRKRRRLRTIAMLPTLLTLGNLCFGFAAVYACSRDMMDLGAGIPASQNVTLQRPFLEKHAPSFLSIGCWLILAAMLCDALDGRVARKTGQASKFGEQLDSLADMVSFGVAPAMMMVALLHREMQQWGYRPLYFEHFGQMTLLFGIIYASCAALRLARFNVEATLDEAAHLGFKGLPSPGAALAVISVVFLHDHLDVEKDWQQTTAVLAKMLPFCTLFLALLMVSRLPYTHAVSWLLKRRPFEHVILVLLALPLAWIYTEQAMVAVAWFFALSGPVRYVVNRIGGAAEPAATAPAAEPVSTEAEANKKAL